MSAPRNDPSRTGNVPSSPFFFRLIRRSMALFVAAVGVLAAFVPAPLQEPADMGKVPNPAKSAWFLLWIQELVSYSRHLIYLVALLALFFLALPFALPGKRDQEAEGSARPVAVLSVAVFASIVALTAIAYFFRGKDWGLFVRP